MLKEALVEQALQVLVFVADAALLAVADEDAEVREVAAAHLPYVVAEFVGVCCRVHGS